jgi:hypothetical protein
LAPQYSRFKKREKKKGHVFKEFSYHVKKLGHLRMQFFVRYYLGKNIGTKIFFPDLASGLPDSLCSNQKSQFWYILEGLRMENAGIFYGHLEYFTVIWNILQSFGIHILCPFGNVVVI